LQIDSKKNYIINFIHRLLSHSPKQCHPTTLPIPTIHPKFTALSLSKRRTIEWPDKQVSSYKNSIISFLVQLLDNSPHLGPIAMAEMAAAMVDNAPAVGNSNKRLTKVGDDECVG